MDGSDQWLTICTKLNLSGGGGPPPPPPRQMIQSVSNEVQSLSKLFVCYTRYFGKQTKYFRNSETYQTRVENLLNFMNELSVKTLTRTKG